MLILVDSASGIPTPLQPTSNAVIILSLDVIMAEVTSQVKTSAKQLQIR